MTRKRNVITSITLLLLLMTQCDTPNEYPNELDKLVPGSSLIFKGEVVLLKTLTTDESNVSNAGVVNVSEIIEAPNSFPDTKEMQLTVRFSDIKQIKIGDRRMFFTEPYWIGEAIGVTEIGSITNSNPLYEDKNIISYIKQARDKQDDAVVRKFIDTSNLVVSGKVVSIEIPNSEPMMGTEHDPEWREAEIEVEEMMKGDMEGTRVKVLFASGKDVLYHLAPKFSEGDEGIFIVQQADNDTAKLLNNQYMLIDPSCFLKGKENVAKIRSLME